jgi:periplasmic mercuric ion binding protein
MWRFAVGLFVVMLALPTTILATTVEIDVKGLTCAFCVDSLQRRLKKFPDIEQVDVSLKTRKVRIVSSADHIDIDVIRQAVIDSGFTPVDIRVIGNDD